MALSFVLNLQTCFAKSRASLRAEAFYPQNLARTGCVLEAHNFEQLLTMDPFLSSFFLSGGTCPRRIRRCNSIPYFPLFRRIDFFSGSDSWDTQPNCSDSFCKATDSFPPLFLDFSLGCSLSVSEQTFVAEFASRIRYVVLTYGKMPKHYTTDLCHIL